MGPLERLIGSFYLFRYIGEEEKREGRDFFLFRKSFLVSFLLPEPPESLPRLSQEPPESLPRLAHLSVRRTSGCATLGKKNIELDAPPRASRGWQVPKAPKNLPKGPKRHPKRLSHPWTLVVENLRKILHD